MKRLILDMDDVIADTTSQLIKYYHRDFGVLVTRESIVHPQEVQGFPGNHEAIMQYPYEKDFFRTLIPHEYSREVVKELNQKYNLFIVSAAMEFPLSLNEKLEWLREHFPFLTWKQIVFCGSKSIVHGDYMIDDLAHNLETFNGEKFLFTAPHNHQYTHFHRLNNWKEVGDRFL